ncbi:MAG TPA: DUF5916 domain-containing protein [Thermoanaerobaculia bacterium]|nr:DUF5916 domain-containing protein [Thermoanaerobaculia bacterium]
MRRTRDLRPALLLLFAALIPVRPLLAAQAPPEPPPEPLHIARAAGPIEVDGQLGDAGWNGATRVETFYETSPGDNVEPKVKTVAWLTYDDRFFYAAFDFSDPDPKGIRAPFGDHDDISSSTDYGGIILDTRNDGKTAFMFLANPRNLQYDAISSDVSGEDPSPDFYWDSAARITATGWTLEIRVPFSSLRYNSADVQTWGILLYRNRPRDFRYQMFNVKIPRGASCFICNEQKITGLDRLPSGNHAVLAPYVTGKRESFPEGASGSRLADRPVQWETGLDAKWTPNADTAIDATINPDFSQVESDVAQITANERFALFFPEKRPFFLESLDLFATPLQAVYTRNITSPRWGVRATGEAGSALYTVLIAEDRGGGSVILPGRISSSFAPQDFASRVAVGRGRQDFGNSFVSFLLTDREIEGGGHNRVFGPDFQWRPNGSDTVTGQLLLSDSRTPDRPDLAAEWNGQSLRSNSSYLSWVHSTSTWGWTLQYNEAGDEFRADLGFVPQVGDRDSLVSVSRMFFVEHGIFRRIRPFVRLRNVDGVDGALLLRQAIPGIQLEGLWNGFINVEHHTETVRAGSHLFDTDFFVTSIQVSPSQRLTDLVLSLTAGDDVDFDNERPARGITASLQGTLRPTDHLAVQLNGSRRQLDVSPTGTGPRDARLFTADVARVKATYSFTSRAFLRLVAQRVHTTRNPDLYNPAFGALPREDDEVTGSALFSYKLNWQTVLFLGYSDDRALTVEERLAPIGRALFFKISYAFQR